MPEIILSVFFFFGYAIGVKAISPDTPDYWVIIVGLIVLARIQRKETIKKAQRSLCQAINQAAGCQIIKEKGREE